MFWVDRQDGSVKQQDKFGRGVPVVWAGNLTNPHSVKIFHPKRYNTDLKNPCQHRECSHLCVVIPGHQARCRCPDDSRNVHIDSCDAANEPPLPQPLVCKCRNGGICIGDDGDACHCPDSYSGQHCENHVQKERTTADSNTAALVVPLFLVVVILIAAVGLWFWYRRDRS